jgi:hypothetical protein
LRHRSQPAKATKIAQARTGNLVIASWPDTVAGTLLGVSPALGRSAHWVSVTNTPDTSPGFLSFGFGHNQLAQRDQHHCHRRHEQPSDHLRHQTDSREIKARHKINRGSPRLMRIQPVGSDLRRWRSGTPWKLKSK